MEDKKLNETESLELIAQMIHNTKRNFEKGSGNIFIIWGCATLFTTLLVSAMLYLTGQQVYNWLWMLIPLIGYSWTYFAGTRKKLVYTQIDQMIHQTWGIVGLAAVGIPIAFYLLVLFKQDLIVNPAIAIFRFVPFLEILICSLGLAITGGILDFKVCRIGGCMGIVIAILMLFNFPWALPLGFVVWAIACMIVPGIKLNQYIKKNQNHV